MRRAYTLDAPSRSTPRHPRPLRGAAPARARRSREHPAAVAAAPWTLPLRAAPQAFDADDTLNARLLANQVRENPSVVGTLFDFAAETGLLTAAEIASALDALERHEDGRRVQVLFDTAGARLAARLDDRVRRLTDQAWDGAGLTLYVSTYDGHEASEAYIVLDGQTRIESTLPVHELDEPVALLAYDACRWIATALGLDPVADWSLGGPGSYWLDERLDEFLGLDPAVTASPEAFWATLSDDKAAFYTLHAYDQESAADLLETMLRTEADVASLKVLMERAGPMQETPRGLLDNATVLVARYPADSLNHAWCAWSVCAANTALAALARDAAPPPDMRDETHALESLIGMGPGARWWHEARDELLQHVGQAGELVEIAYPWSAGRGPAILASLEHLADAIALILAAPSEDA